METKTGRNNMDVIMELVDLHIKATERSRESVTAEDIEGIYLKYHKLIKDNR